LEKRQQEKLREVADKNMRDGEAFRKENSLKDGVKQLENGLQYEILEKGHGESPGIEDHVKVHFVGKTIDGKIFESTREESQAPTLPVGAFGVRGIVEALLRMKPGSKWQLVIPPDLAYGVDGAMPEIEPNQTLIFEVELLEVVKQ
jgi:FKBP-type peptidyl-prolyl cis-trans isomerase